MMATLVRVTQRDVKRCDRCGTLIAFHANRNGRRYPVEVYDHPKLGMVYHAKYGAYNNMTMWHSCEARLEQQRRFEAQRKEEVMNARKNAVANEYLPRITALCQNWNEERRPELEAVVAEYKAALEAVESTV